MIVGTAGHVDHGKTTLVRALTGIDTDRLKEEKARGISIDLGFAYLAVPDGANIGFIDVPGHERLVRTMVAGAAAIDFALLVVAADDGIMPQTREHLDVLDLLGLTSGIIVVTKCDRVDADRRAAVAAEIATATARTGLAGMPTVFVAATTGDGIDALRLRLIDASVHDAAARTRDAPTQRIFRMSVDRAFTLTGVGTVAAGTALAGAVAVEDEVTVMPQRIRARVRSLHAQNRTAIRGVGGERCALALAGTAMSRNAVGRGAWICGERNPRDSARLDAEVSLLPGEHKPLGQWSPVSFHCGASAVQGRVVVLSGSTLPPGHNGLVQIVLETALPLRHGDRFVLRDPGAGRTVGGGVVLDPRAPVRRRRAPDRLARLAAMRPTDPAIALDALLAVGPGLEDLDLFASDRGLTDRVRNALLAPLARLETSKVIVVATPKRLLALEVEVAATLAAFHADHPDQPGMTGERMRLILVQPDSVPLPKPLFAALVSHLVARRQIVLQGPWMLLPGHVVQLAAEEQRVAAALTPLLEAERFRPPRVRDIAKALNLAEPLVRRTCKALARSGDLVEIANDHFFLRATVVEMGSCARALSEACPGGVFSAADFRDRLDNGRKVAIQILEFFDRHGLTRRVGDLRRAPRTADLPWGADD